MVNDIDALDGFVDAHALEGIYSIVVGVFACYYVVDTGDIYYGLLFVIRVEELW